MSPEKPSHNIAQTTIHKAVRTLGILWLFAFSIRFLTAAEQPLLALQLARTINLPDVQGKFDHLAIDLAGSRLFVTSGGKHSVEVVDLKDDTVVQIIAGLGKPHGLAWVSATSSLYVSDGALAELRLYKGQPLALAGTIKLSDDADDMAYDPTTLRLFVGHGGKDAANPAQIAVIDTDRFALVENLPASTHPEGIEIDLQSHRVFANIADSNEVTVIDQVKKSAPTIWKLTIATGNVPLAFDGQHQLIYVACRKPGMLIAMDATTGKEVASAQTSAGADDLFYDAALSRVYVITGAGEVDTYQVDAARKLRPLEILYTAAGAKTGLFVPSQNLLYVGVPGTTIKASEIRVYSTIKTERGQ